MGLFEVVILHLIMKYGNVDFVVEGESLWDECDLNAWLADTLSDISLEFLQWYVIFWPQDITVRSNFLLRSDLHQYSKIALVVS